jgi:hypothetical protein
LHGFHHSRRPAQVNVPAEIIHMIAEKLFVDKTGYISRIRIIGDDMHSAMAGHFIEFRFQDDVAIRLLEKKRACQPAFPPAAMAAGSQ